MLFHFNVQSLKITVPQQKELVIAGEDGILKTKKKLKEMYQALINWNVQNGWDWSA